jgi:hypothetical protein
MKEWIGVGIIVLAVTLCVPASSWGQREVNDQLEVVESAVCLDVVDRECVGRNNVFPAQVGKVYCLTRLYGARADTEITHVWFFGDMERARVQLAIRSVNFRTYSSKIIRPMEIGDWRVEVVDAQNRILKIIEFRVE